MQALQTLVAALPNMQTTYLGIPASRTGRVVSTITLAGAVLENKGAGQLIRHCRYFITFGYAIDQDTAPAELTLAALVDAFVAAWKVDRTLGNTCASCTLDFHMADRPEYQMDAAQENRVYPIIADCVQYDSYPLPQ